MVSMCTFADVYVSSIMRTCTHALYDNVRVAAAWDACVGVSVFLGSVSCLYVCALCE